MGDDFERAVLFSMEANVPSDVKAEAERYCQDIINSSDGWQVCLQRYMQGPRSEIAFFCLTVITVRLDEYASLSAGERQNLREQLMSWCTSVLPRLADGADAAYLRNKHARVLVEVFIQEYPSWGSFFDDLLSLLPEGGLCEMDMLLRVCRSMHDTLFERDSQQTKKKQAFAQAVKDGMRGAAMPQLAEAWGAILAGSIEGELLDLANDVLEILGFYVQWNEASLITNETVWPLVASSLGVSELQSSAMKCLRGLVSKGMDVKDKAHLLEMVDFGAVVSSVYANAAESQDVEVLESVGHLVNHTMLMIMNKLASEPFAMSLLDDPVMGLALELFNHEDRDLSLITAEGVRAYIAFVKQGTDGLTHDQEVWLGHILTVSASHVRYSESSDDWRVPPGEETDFRAYRGQYGTVWKNIARLSFELVLSRMQEILCEVDVASFASIEGALHLLCLLQEINDAMKRELKIREALGGPFDEVLGGILGALLEHDMARHLHPAVRLGWCELIVRFSAYFTSPEYLTEALSILCDERGLCHEEPVVRTAATSCLRRFVKRQSALIAQHLDMTEVLSGVASNINTESIGDQGDMYEALGILIRTCPNDVQAACLHEVVNPLLEKLQELLCVNPNDLDAGTPELVHSIAYAVTAVFKAFSQCNSRMEELAGLMTPAFDLASQTILRFAPVDEIRSGMLGMFHATLRPLGIESTEALASLITKMLMHKTVGVVTDAARVLEQVARSFGEPVLPVIDEPLQVTIQAVFDLLHEMLLAPYSLDLFPSTPVLVPATADEFDAINLAHAYYSLVRYLATNGLTAVLLSERNAPAFNSVLRSITRAIASGSSEVGVKRICVTCVRAMAADLDWDAVDFGTYVTELVLPAVFKAALVGGSTPASDKSLLSEVASALRCLLEHGGGLVGTALQRECLPLLGAEGDDALDFLAALQTEQPEVFVRYFHTFILQCRASIAAT